MPSLRSLLSGDAAALKRLLVASGAVVACGVAIIVAGVLGDWGQTRFFGAGLISVGGALGGAAIGFSAPLRGGIGARLTAWRGWIALITAVIIGAPALIATLSGAVGPMFGGGDAQDKLLVGVGVFIGLAFALLTIAAGIISVQATRRRVGNPREDRL